MRQEAEHMPSALRLRELLVGKKITQVRMTEEGHRRPEGMWEEPGPTGYLTLSDGTELVLWGNDGGCACGAGCYPLTELNGCDNIITNVDVDYRPDGDELPCQTCGAVGCWNHNDDGYFRIFVFAEDRRIPLASFEGSDGNGYYGTGWWLEVRHAEVA